MLASFIVKMKTIFMCCSGCCCCVVYYVYEREWERIATKFRNNIFGKRKTFFSGGVLPKTGDRTEMGRYEEDIIIYITKQHFIKFLLINSLLSCTSIRQHSKAEKLLIKTREKNAIEMQPTICKMELKGKVVNQSGSGGGEKLLHI